MTSDSNKTESQCAASAYNLPAKEAHVHIDSTKHSPASLLQSGGLYSTSGQSPQALALLKPQILCPSCGQVCFGIAGAQPQYEVPQTNAGYLPLGDNFAEPPRMLYNLEPCGCRASQEWAAALTAELNHRLEGGSPRQVVDMTETERQEKVLQLEKRISKLYSAQEKAISQEHKDSIQYRLVVLTDQLMRLVPGAHNKIPAVTLSAKVRQWATDKGYHKPPVAVSTVSGMKAVAKFIDTFTAPPYLANLGWPMPKKTSPMSPGVSHEHMQPKIVWDSEGASNGYYEKYPMPKNLGQLAPSGNPDDKVGYQPALGNILATATIDELIALFSSGSFRLPRTWLLHLYDAFRWSRPMILEVIGQVWKVQVSYKLDRYAAIIEHNLKSHLDSNVQLLPFTIQFMAHICKKTMACSSAEVSAPSNKPVAACNQPDTPETPEQFHAQFLRKRRKIRRVTD